MDTLRQIKVDALLSSDLHLLKQIKRYEGHVLLLRKYIPNPSVLDPDLFNDLTYLLDHSQVQSELLDLINNTPPFTFISLSLLSDEQVEELNEQA